MDVITCASVNLHANYVTLKWKGKTWSENAKYIKNGGEYPEYRAFIKLVRECMTQRCKRVIQAAIVHDVDALVLGAWGSGVFGNSAEEVAGWFRAALTEIASDAKAGGAPGKIKMQVVFAIPEFTADDVAKKRVFEAAFGIEGKK